MIHPVNPVKEKSRRKWNDKPTQTKSDPPADVEAVMFILPCLIIYFISQRYIVQGIVTTGLKG